jgi:hypothetical protein
MRKFSHLERFKYPYTTPVGNLHNWFNYLLQCRSDKSFQKDKKELFEKKYLGKVVEWVGYCTSVGRKTVKFIVTPTQCKNFYTSEVSLHYLPGGYIRYPNQ